MKKCIKIKDNLYLGDMYSIPKDYGIEIAAAREIFMDNVTDSKDIKNGYFWKDKTLYLDFYDYPNNKKDINLNLIKIFLDTIKKYINSKKIYVHCIYGVNRSPTLVFIYLITTNEYKNLSIKEALNKFKILYNSFHMNPGWDNFIERYYPFENFK